LGTWFAHKGPQVLADALALLPSDLFDDGKLSATGVGPSPFPLFQDQVVQRSRGRLCAKAAVPPEEVPELIDNCDVLVVPSTWAENAPLVVLEAQAAGKPVLASRLGGLTELITDGVDGLLFSPGSADELAQLLSRLANDRGQLARLQDGVRRPPSTQNWTQQVLEQYEQLLSPPAVASAAQAPRFSVVIPVLNGGERLLQLLKAVFSQTAKGGVEVTVCDSGSTDGAVNEARSRYPSLRITHIAPEEYNHGLVRTRLVTEARSDLVALFSQDAVPVGQDYLEQLAEAFKNPDVAGAYARQIPRPGADPLVRANLERWTPSLPGETIRLSRLLPGEALEALIPLQQMERARFDNVGSMVRRSVILDCPFPARAFGEDLAWGAAVLQRGMSLAYVPSAQVEHHHDPTLREAFHRNFHAHRQAASEFGHLAVPSLRDAASAVVLGLPTDLASGPQWMVRGLPRRAMSLLGQWAGGRKGRKSRGQNLEL
ncbi:MAG TPA: hypothetical protein DIU15_09565, partial [Deltaproteobacteria bacterium]|nr:hypothetical protein [Deltaproteobacteria bacterium]